MLKYKTYFIILLNNSVLGPFRQANQCTSYQGHLRGKVAIRSLSFIHCFIHSFTWASLPLFPPPSPARPSLSASSFAQVTLSSRKISNPSPSKGSLLPRLEDCGTTSSTKHSLTSMAPL